MLTFGSHKTIGLTIDGNGIRYAALRKRKTWELERSGYLSLPEGMIVDDGIANAAGIAMVLKQWVKSEKLAGMSVNLAVPTSQIIVRKLRIPSTNAKELKHLIELEVETTLHLPFEDPVFDFVSVGKDAESTQVLVFAAPRKWIRTSVSLLEDSGLKVKSVSLPAAALARSVFSQQAEKPSETMLIHIGEMSLEIFMFHEGSPIFMRAINLVELGGHEQAQLSDGQVADIIAEISRILNFYQFSLHEGSSRIVRAVIAGPRASRVKLITALSEAQPDIAFGEATSELFDNRSGLTNANVAFLAAAGLALPAEKSFQVDLLPRVDREAKIFPAIIIGAAGVLILMIALAGYAYTSDKLSTSDNKSTLKKLDDDLLMIQNGLMAGNDNGNGTGAASSNPLQEIEAIKAKQRDVVAIVKELDGKLPSGARITTIGYAAKGQIEINAGFEDMKDASRYLFDLRRMSFAGAASLKSISKSEVQAKVQAGDKLVVNKPYAVAYSVTVKPAKEAGTDGSAQ